MQAASYHHGAPFASPIDENQSLTAILRKGCCRIRIGHNKEVAPPLLACRPRSGISDETLLVTLAMLGLISVAVCSFDISTDCLLQRFHP